METKNFLVWVLKEADNSGEDTNLPACEDNSFIHSDILSIYM